MKSHSTCSWKHRGDTKKKSKREKLISFNKAISQEIQMSM